MEYMRFQVFRRVIRSMRFLGHDSGLKEKTSCGEFLVKIWVRPEGSASDGGCARPSTPVSRRMQAFYQDEVDKLM